MNIGLIQRCAKKRRELASQALRRCAHGDDHDCPVCSAVTVYNLAAHACFDPVRGQRSQRPFWRRAKRRLLALLSTFDPQVPRSA